MESHDVMMIEGVLKVKPIHITKEQAGRFLLAHQGLLPAQNMEGKEGILNFIKQIGCIQFDPLNRVGENPHLVLQSRVKNYRKNMLEELLYNDRKLLDGWDKNMSIYSIDDWPYFNRYRERASRRYADKESVKKILPGVREAITEKGPISSIDLDFDQKVDWSWAPTRAARAALESMYAWGELIVYNKVGTRKVYDFAEKYIPEEVFLHEDPNTSEEEYFLWHVKRRIAGVGMLWPLSGSTAWLGIKGLKKGVLLQTINKLLKKEEILEVTIEGISHSFYILSNEESLLRDILNNRIDVYKKVVLLGPLDNLIWDRKLIKEIFNFDYVWEVYKPVAERKYGYYVLPVLYGDRFIARCEPICSSDGKELIIKNWWWEEGVKVTDKMKKAINNCLFRFKEYLNLNTVQEVEFD